MKHSRYRELISGTRAGFSARLARTGLAALSHLYGGAVFARNRAYDVGLLRQHRVAIPVVSIGNLTAGGTGKTPVVAAVVDWFTTRGVRPVILSRGYASRPGEANDEKRVLDLLCPETLHLQGADRIPSAREAIRRQGEVIVLDDGFQHRRLARDLNVVLIDALDPWGGGKLLPRGLLREPISSLRRADLVILTRADQCSPAVRQEIRDRLNDEAAVTAVIEIVFEPTGFLNAAGSYHALAAEVVESGSPQAGHGAPPCKSPRIADGGGRGAPLLGKPRNSGQPPVRCAAPDERGLPPSAEVSRHPTSLWDGEAESVAAFCGIGNPQGFRRTLERIGLPIPDEKWRTFPDHHAYTAADFVGLARFAKSTGVNALVTTQKDLVKIPRIDLEGIPLWALCIRARVITGIEHWEAALSGILAAKVVTFPGKTPDY